jgi:putative ABC transport system ATP-binding protein
MIKTENLKFKYGANGAEFSFPNIDLGEEENLLVIGKSGVGKTTFIHLLAGLLKPLSGKISINQTDLDALSAQQLDAFRGQNIGLVFQKNHAIRSLSVFDNLKARLFFSNNQISENTLDDLLKDLDLSELKHRRINQLSEGQLQRLGIGMAVVHNPYLLLADEPTSSLDDENCAVVIDLLLKQAKKNKANLILITHDNRIKPYFQNSMTL